MDNMTPTQKVNLDQLLKESSELDMVAFLKHIVTLYPAKITFSTSFSFEDQLISHLLLQENIPVSIFTLDTGRLFSETYSVWNNTNEKYNTHIKAYYPDQQAIEKFVEIKGPNAFYESVQNRQDCCFIRKVAPLKRALAGNEIWITGLRAEHSANRKDLSLLEWDQSNQIIKYHPLLHWTTEAVRTFIQEHHIPYNALHDKGFVSIGCAPCTRAIKTGEDFRAGRWWWEDAEKKECGLHVHEVKLINADAK
jgi:phosphoadenosine phosphosulfate reductase